MGGAKEIIFFAYQGKSQGIADDNVDSITNAIKNYNQYQATFEARSWESYKKTTAINKEVLSAIEQCAVFICDLTYFNHNVLFELGFAVGKDKKIMILLNENINNSTNIYNEFILKNIRYIPLTNSKDITTALQQKHYENGLLNKFVNIDNIVEDRNDVFYIQSEIKNEPSVVLTHAIEECKIENKFSLVTDDTSEVAYKPTEWYFQSIVKSKCIIIHLLGSNISKASQENAKKSFLAGLSLGLNNKVLMAAPAKYKAPLDYHDILIQYSSSDNLVETVKNWLTKEVYPAKKYEIKEKEVHELDLIKLGVGCEVAEQEKDGLLKYFIETAAYHAALKLDKSILVGRKGTGKSAIYIKVLNELAKDKLFYIVNLKPESDELLEDVQLSDLFKTPAAKISFFVSVWKLVIFSKLVQSIYERLMDKESISGYSTVEDEVIKFVEGNETFIKMNVFGVVREISNRQKNRSTIESPQILEELYKTYLNPLINIVKNYFKSINAKYYKVIILADNLDVTWESRHDLYIQSDLILSLLDIEGKIQKTLMDNKDIQINVKEILFLREDIFDYLLKTVTEPDKLTTMSYKVDWEEHPELLKRVMDDRFKYILNLKSDTEVENAWNEFFNFKENQHPFKVIEEITTRRPRDVIYFVSRLFESAINKGHSKVNDLDLNYAIESYSIFLNNNLIAELRAEFPEISTILAKLQQHHGKTLEYQELEHIMSGVKYNQEKQEALVRNLFEKGYMLGFDQKTNKPFSDLETLKKKLEERKFLFFRNKVFVIAHTKYYFIKNKSFSSF